MNFLKPLQKIFYLIEMVLLGTFLLIYSCGNSVLWVIWTFEHDDLEQFYACDGSNGTSYVNSVIQDTEEDGQKNIPPAAHSFAMLIKCYCAVSQSNNILPVSEENKQRLFDGTDHSLSLSGFPSLIFHPPTFEGSRAS